MLLYNHMAIFCHIAEEASLTGAAKVTGLPKSTVSLRLKELEDELGVRLLHRTTRKLTLTEHGREFYQRCQQMVSAGSNAAESMKGLQSEPAGRLKINCPYGMADSLLPQVLQQFSDRYPKVSVQLISSNQRIDIIAEGFDLSFRFGLLDDSSLIARTIQHCQRWILASPDYITAHPKLEKPQQLREHRCIVSEFTPRWDFRSGKRKISIHPQPYIHVTDVVMAKNLAMEGVGICMLPDISAHKEVEAGLLVPLLTNYPLEPRDLNLIYPSRNLQSAAVKCFIETLLEVSKNHDW